MSEIFLPEALVVSWLIQSPRAVPQRTWWNWLWWSNRTNDHSMRWRLDLCKLLRGKMRRVISKEKSTHQNQFHCYSALSIASDTTLERHRRYYRSFGDLQIRHLISQKNHGMGWQFLLLSRPKEGIVKMIWRYLSRRTSKVVKTISNLESR